MKTFEEWLDEIEGYATRRERLFDEIGRAHV